MLDKTSHFANLSGVIALIFWSTSALLVMFIGKIPIFELQAFLFSFSFMAALCIFGPKKMLNTALNLPIQVFIVGSLGIFLNNFFFVTAFQYAPAEKVDLINYLWPVMAILFSFLLPKETLKFQHFLGAGLAFFGVYLLLTEGQGLKGFEVCYWKGYLLAFLDALSWCIFTLYLRHFKKSPIEMMGIFCGMTAVFSFVSHMAFEHFVMPTMNQMSFVLILALTSQCSSYYLWNKGLKKGNYHLLCVLSYFNPIISIGLLVVFGFVENSNMLMISTFYVSFGAIIASEIPTFYALKKASRYAWRTLEARWLAYLSPPSRW